MKNKSKKERSIIDEFIFTFLFPFSFSFPLIIIACIVISYTITIFKDNLISETIAEITIFSSILFTIIISFFMYSKFNEFFNNISNKKDKK